MARVNFFDKRIFGQFSEEYLSRISTVLSLVLIVVTIPEEIKIRLGCFCVLLLASLYVFLWYRSSNLEEVDIDIEGSTVTIKTGNIFKQQGFKVVAFNEYFDTRIDDKIISRQSLNGIFINKYFSKSTAQLDKDIENHQFDADEIIEENTARKSGKKIKYSIGTIYLCGEYILTAFSKFDEHNRACLTMPEYLGFLITFWDKVNKVYAQKSVSVPIFGSGITRIKEHRDISDEDLLKIMLWTFRISEMRFKYPAKLTIVIHKDKIDKISLLDIKSSKNGL